jgi:hypothetical protein
MYVKKDSCFIPQENYFHWHNCFDDIIIPLFTRIITRYFDNTESTPGRYGFPYYNRNQKNN